LKILLATSRYPWPPRRGDQIRAVQMLDFLAGRHAVTLLTPEPGPDQPPPPPQHSTPFPFRLETYRLHRGPSLATGFGRALWKNLPLQSGLFYQPDLGRRLRQLAREADLGLLQLVRLAIHLEDFGRVPLLVDFIDSLSLSFSLRADIDRLWRRPALRLEARLLALWERRLIERAARVTVVCERDRQALENRLPRALSDKVSVVRLSVRERQAEPPAPGEVLASPDHAGPILAMTGNLGYFVNADAVSWWLAEVWPVLRRVRPGLRVVVTGDRPARAVRRAIAEAGAAAEGEVLLIPSPRDLRSILEQATLALAPMRCGAGVPIKVLEAWACGVPVVASPWAVAGTSGRQGEDFRMVGQHPIEWVSAILELLDNPVERKRLADNGRRRLATDYGRETVKEQLLSVVEGLGVG
jgi:glycosyltransferase involved in cell wall biosynthesis